MHSDQKDNDKGKLRSNAEHRAAGNRCDTAYLVENTTRSLEVFDQEDQYAWGLRADPRSLDS